MMFREWFTRKATKTIEAAIEPTKKAIQRSVEKKSDWAAKLIKLGLVTFLTMLVFKDDDRAKSDSGKSGNQSPNNITINNYICERSSRDDPEH